jgi:hypothetical protein
LCDAAAQKRVREFDDALYSSLLSRAHSDQARGLVETVTGLVAAHELDAGTRFKKRKKKQEDLRSAVERFLSDLLQAQSVVKTHGLVYRNLRPQRFTDTDVSYRTFKRLVDALVHLELLEIYIGFQNIRDSFGPSLAMMRKATRFRATEKLLQICDHHGVRPDDFHQHFLIPLPENPLRLRAASRRTEYGDKIRGKRMRASSRQRSPSAVS